MTSTRSIKLEEGEIASQEVDGKWQLVEPAKAGVPTAMEMTSITSGLAGLEIQRVVEANAGEVKEYGFDPARISLAFRSKGQKDPRRIRSARRRQPAETCTARVPGDKRVFLVSSFLDSTFNKTPLALRDKVILKFDRQKADGLELIEGATNVQLSKKGSDWMIVKPLAARADFAVVESSSSASGRHKWSASPRRTPPTSPSTGSTNPRRRCNVSMGSSRATWCSERPKTPSSMPRTPRGR